MIFGLFLSATMSLADLQALCAPDQAISECSLYVLGVTQGASMEAGLTHDRTHFCIPDDVSEIELGAVVKRLIATDLTRFPQDKTLDASGFIGAVLIKQYPCSTVHVRKP